MNKVLAAFLLLVYGCGGGESPPAPPVGMLCTAFAEWETPTKRMNGSPLLLEEINNFTIYVSNSVDPNDMDLVFVIEVTDRNLSAWEITQLDEDHTYYFYMTVTDIENRTSGFSNVLDKQC